LGTRYQGTPEEIRAVNAYIKLQRAAVATMARAGRHLASVNLTKGQYGVLDALFYSGPLQLGQLAEKVLKSDGNMTTVVDNLERRGLVERERNREDRRVITVSLTEAGRQLISEVLPVHIATLVELMSILSPVEQEVLARLCRQVGRQERVPTSGEDLSADREAYSGAGE
jgi:MarR family transcriptional regulator, 2-MHQ and catechol-resistance regulon repressor